MADTERPTASVHTLPTSTERSESAPLDRGMLEQVVLETQRLLEERLSRPSPIALNTMEEIVNFAEHAARTEMVPKQFKSKPDDIIIAVMFGKELGLPAIQALQSIAVVNGRPTVWGDAVPGLCWASGKVESIKEYYTGDEGTDAYTAVCEVRRRGNPDTYVGRFSIADTKVAGLHGRDNVHKTYPKRMLQWRARHYAMHDAFPDVLRGIGTTELEREEDEAQRVPSWAMPQPEQSWFSRKATAQRDGWDDTWFSGFADKLIAQVNAWKWKEMLLTGLAEAPTLRDVDEIDDLPQVRKTLASAPAEAKAEIEAAFGEARKRFLLPGQPGAAPAGQEAGQAETEGKPDAKAAREPRRKRAAPPAKSAAAPGPADPPLQDSQATAQAASGDPAPATEAAQETTGATGATFEHFLLDASGSPAVDDPYPIAADWCAAFEGMHEKAGDARIGLIQQNRDAIDAALADAELHDSWRDWLRALLADADGAEQGGGAVGNAAAEIPVIALSAERGGKPNWGQYIRELTAALQLTGADQYLDFLAVQAPQWTDAPASSRLLIAKAFSEQADRVGLPVPPAIRDLAKPADKDATLVDSMLAEVNRMTDEHAIHAYSNSPSVMTPLARFEREGKAELVSRVRKGFAVRVAAVTAGKPDATFVDATLAEANRLTEADAVRALLNSPAVTAPLARLDREGKAELAARLRNGFERRLAVLAAAQQPART